MLLKERQQHYNDLYKERQQDHYAFRHSYSPGQERFLLISNFVLMVYGFVYMMFVKGTYGRPVYAVLGVIALLLCSACLIEHKIVKDKSARWHENFYECFSVICAMVYVAWGLIVVWASINSGRVANYLPVIIVYAVCSMFMYFSTHHYLALFLITFAGSRIIMKICPDYNFDMSVYANIVLYGIVLTIGGMSKYKISLEHYLASTQAGKLREALQINNDELKNTAEKLSKNIEAQRLFTASMNHELRSPLNGVIGLLQVLEDDESITGESHDNIGKALYSSKTLISIVNDLLDYYKLEAGEFNIVKGVFDVREITEVITGTFSAQAEEKNLKFSVKARPDMPCILAGDGVRIQQIITNIVSNAIKYTLKGSVSCEIDYADDKLKIVVSDTGIGIKKEYIDVLFDPFKRLEEHRNSAIQGTGLGLSIVKQLVDQMRGTLKLDSEYGKGSCFTVVIPAAVSNRTVKYGDPMEKIEKIATAPDFTGKRFLCVDDNKVNLTVFKGLFKGTGSEITIVDSGEKCLEKIAESKYDVIFLDHMMPGMDGLETFDRMEKSEHMNRETPVVMLTANAGSEAEMLYKNLGFSGYLSKPLLKANLYEITKKNIK